MIGGFVHRSSYEKLLWKVLVSCLTKAMQHVAVACAMLVTSCDRKRVCENRGVLWKVERVVIYW